MRKHRKMRMSKSPCSQVLHTIAYPALESQDVFQRFFEKFAEGSPSSVTAFGGATFPREGEGSGNWQSLDCTVVSIGAVISLPPWRGKVAGRRPDG